MTQKAQHNHLSSKNKSKTVWQIINNNKSVNEPISQVKYNNTLVTDPYDIAESFNNFFVDQINDYLAGFSSVINLFRILRR